MSTSFVTIVPPPGISPAEAYALLDAASSSDLPARAPRPFIDALIVRKRVFVDEQKCRLSTEIDEDDARSFHWLAHASMAPGPSPGSQPPSDAFERRKRVGGQVPVSTGRLGPPPHGPHPAPGSVDGEGGEEVVGRVEGGDVPTRLHDGREAYVKLGRLATVEELRGLGLARLVVTEALTWAARNPDNFHALPADAVEKEQIQREGREWHGLVLAHAQLNSVKFYHGLGFELDPELGQWMEEGIPHVAMWKRLELQK